ncbi:MAG: hypothetical protein ACKO24_09385 [Leptolyngbyaceae cyanobacterium]
MGNSNRNRLDAAQFSLAVLVSAGCWLPAIAPLLTLAQQPDSTPATSPPATQTAGSELKVKISEVLIEGVQDQPELKKIIYNTIQIRVGQEVTISRLNQAKEDILSTGFFKGVDFKVPWQKSYPAPLKIFVEPNSILRSVVLNNIGEGTPTALVQPNENVKVLV